MPVVGDQITTTVAHYATGAAALLECRFVNVDNGDPTAWSAAGITQISAAGEGPPWRYKATRSSTGMVPGTYEGEWRLAASPAVVSVDPDEIVLTATASSPGPASLVDELRQMVSVSPTQYTVGDTTYWSDDQLEAVLVAHALPVRAASIALLRGPDGTITTGRVLANGSFGAGGGAILTRGGEELEGWTIDRHGILTFAGDVASDVAWEFTGQTYDLHAAAAAVFSAWAGAVSLHFDVSLDGQSMSRSQKHTHLLQQAEWHRARGLVGSIALSGDDMRHDLGRYDGWEHPAFSRFR